VEHAGENSIRVSAWIEKVKASVLESLGAVVAKIGWLTLFERCDTDGDGEVDYEEFEAAVRADIGIPTRLTMLAQQSLGAQWVARGIRGIPHNSNFVARNKC
jgi:hypothetical protein